MMRILVCGKFFFNTRVVSNPFIPGILTSIRIRSGFSSLAFFIVSAESEASPHTSQLSRSRISGTNLGPDFGEGDNPTRDQFKTKADVVKFVQEAVADGAKVIQEQGDAGLERTAKLFGNRLAHNSYIWALAIEHSAEHYGQLVVYYRANHLVPPDSRR
jgi:hypothetical protein